MAKIGYGLPIKEIPGTVKDELGRIEEEAFKNGEDVGAKKFKDNLPSLGWVYRLLKRYPDVSQKMPEVLGYQRAHVSETGIRNWFEIIENFLEEEHNIEVKEFFTEANGNRIYKLDESGFPLGGTNGKLKVLTEMGTKNVFKLGPDLKEQITVLGCCSSKSFRNNAWSSFFLQFPRNKPRRF